MTDLRLAVLQAPADLAEPQARMDWLAEQLPTIKAQNADLVLLPELFACGYAIAESLQIYAEPQNGPITTTLAQLARAHGVAIHCGYAEREGETLFNSAICFGADGSELVHQRKLAIPPGFERTYFSAGQGCSLFTYKGFKVATLICYDAEFPEAVRHVAALGADLVLCPTALGARWGWVADTLIPARGFENGVFFAYANSAGHQNGMDFLGRSFIGAPDGDILARAGAAPETIFADLSLSRVKAAQARLPYLLDRTQLKL